MEGSVDIGVGYIRWFTCQQLSYDPNGPQIATLQILPVYLIWALNSKVVLVFLSVLFSSLKPAWNTQTDRQTIPLMQPIRTISQ